jgi:hypothetical protein
MTTIGNDNGVMNDGKRVCTMYQICTKPSKALPRTMYIVRQDTQQHARFKTREEVAVALNGLPAVYTKWLEYCGSYFEIVERK